MDVIAPAITTRSMTKTEKAIDAERDAFEGFGSDQLPAGYSNFRKQWANDFAATIYTYERNGNFVAVLYKGRSKSAAKRYSYRNAEGRGAQIKTWLNDANRVAAYRADSKPAVRTLQIGDVLHGMAGYEQTSHHFYKVTALFGRLGVEIVPIGQIREARGDMDGICAPDPSLITGEPMRKKVTGQAGNEVATSCHGTLAPLPFVEAAGTRIYEPKHWTSYG